MFMLLLLLSTRGVMHSIALGRRGVAVIIGRVGSGVRVGAVLLCDREREELTGLRFRVVVNNCREKVNSAETENTTEEVQGNVIRKSIRNRFFAN